MLHDLSKNPIKRQLKQTLCTLFAPVDDTTIVILLLLEKALCPIKLIMCARIWNQKSLKIKHLNQILEILFELFLLLFSITFGLNFIDMGVPATILQFLHGHGLTFIIIRFKVIFIC